MDKEDVGRIFPSQYRCQRRGESESESENENEVGDDRRLRSHHGKKEGLFGGPCYDTTMNPFHNVDVDVDVDVDVETKKKFASRVLNGEPFLKRGWEKLGEVVKKIRWLNSLTLFVVLIFVATVGTIVGFVVICVIGSTYQFHYTETSRARAVEQTINKVSSLVSLVEMEMETLRGSAFMNAERFLSAVIDGDVTDERLLISSIHSVTNIFKENYGGIHFTMGYFIYEYNVLNQWTKLYSVGYDNGKVYIGVSEDYLSQPTEELGDIVLEYYDVDMPSVATNVVMDSAWYSKSGESIALQRDETEFQQYLSSDVFEWSFYSSQYNGVFTPFLSFHGSVSDRDGYFNSKFSTGNSYSIVSWFGSTGNKFSGIIKGYTPENSLSWVIELKNRILLSASDSDSFADLVKPNVNGKNDYISPKEYKTDAVRIVSAELLDTEVLTWILGADPSSREQAQSYSLKGFEIMVFLRNRTHKGGEFLIINAKSSGVVYQDAVFTTSVSIIISLLCIGLTCFLWTKIVFCVSRDFRRLVKGFERVQTMHLDEAKQDESLWSYFEIQKLKDGINMMLDKLIEYKSFLPDHVLKSKTAFDQVKSLALCTTRTKSTVSSENAGYSSGSQTSISTSTTKSHGKDLANTVLGLEKKDLCVLKISFEVENMIDVDLTPKMLAELSDGNFPKLRRDNSFSSSGSANTRFLSTSRNSSKQELWTSFFANVHVSSERFGGHVAEFDMNSATLLFTKANFMGARNCLKFLSIKFSEIKSRFRLCMDESYTGNVGCKRKRFFTFGGRVRDKMREIDRCERKELNSILSNCKIVICARVKEFMSVGHTDFEARIIEKISFRGTEEYIWEMGREKTIARNEWMYELEEQSSFKRWDRYNLAVKYFFDGQKQCKKLIARFCHEDSKDPLAEYWRKKIFAEDGLLSSLGTQTMCTSRTCKKLNESKP